MLFTSSQALGLTVTNSANGLSFVAMDGHPPISPFGLPEAHAQKIISGAKLDENEIVGDKAAMFVRHADAIAASGFSTPDRFVFTQASLNKLLKFNKQLPVHKLILGRGLFDVAFPSDVEAEIFKISELIKARYGDVPVVVRSSALNDARGTGVYTSIKCLNDPQDMQRAIVDVLSSYAVHHAYTWRQKTNSAEGFAIIVEPMMCESLCESLGFKTALPMAPIVSGMGYSSSGIGQGFIKLSFGLGGGEGNRLELGAMAAFDYSLKAFANASFTDFTVNAFNLGRPERLNRTYTVEKNAMLEALEGISLKPIFEGLDVLEKTTGQQVYAEWTIHRTAGVQQNNLVQLALIDPQTEIWEFGNVDSPLFVLSDVRRGKDKEIDSIVVIEELHLLPALARFNEHNSRFMLIYGANLMGGFNGNKRECPLNTEHVSNASIMMMAPNAALRDNWEEHLRGLSETLGVMIGLGHESNFGNDMGVILNYLNAITRHFSTEDRLPVYRRPMMARYSTSTQTAVITPR